MKCQANTQMRLGRSSNWSIVNKRIMRSQGKNTCEAPEIATAIRLQVERRSGELRLFKASGKPHESNARENAQSRRVVEAIRSIPNTALSGERPPTVNGGPLCSPGGD